MAPRWVPTKEQQKRAPFPPHRDPDDWVLMSGGFLVGRVMIQTGHPKKNQYGWSLTGPHTPEAPVPIGGTVEGAEAAKAALLASWRAWQAWADQRDAS